MQYVRSLSGAVSTTWNSINPATLSGAIDVIVVEQEDGSLACSPFHIRFGKFSLLRPSDKKVEFKVNGEKVDLPMKLGEGGEAFFVFETQGQVPENLQTSPLVSPETSPDLRPSALNTPALQEPDPFDLESQNGAALGKRQHSKSTSEAIPIPQSQRRAQSDVGHLTPLSSSPNPAAEPHSAPKLERTATESDLAAVRASLEQAERPILDRQGSVHQYRTERSASNPSPASEDAVSRAMNLSKKLWTSNISNQVTETGDLMLDMTGFKSSDGEALQAEVIARQLLSEEIDGPYDIGALIGADEHGNIWIYSSEEAKEAANKKVARSLETYDPAMYSSTEALSDPGYHSDDSRSDTRVEIAASHARHDSDSALGMASHPSSPSIDAPPAARGDPNKNYAKTLRLTTDQLRQIGLVSGANTMSFTVNRATCNATLWYWRYDVPIVISDIDGTITKSDVLGHVLNTFGRDWTHSGMAKLYTEIAANGYNFLYLTSRSVGQADTTRAYLNGVVQEGYRLPKGPVILSPDRTIAALRREVYLRKPEIFKMACLRDIMALFAGHGGTNNPTESVEAGLHSDVAADSRALSAAKVKAGSPFYAGFGNRLTDALSYRSVNIPSTRIFTINSNSEVSLDLLSLNKYKTAYSTMREIVDHYFPPVGLLVQGGGEEYTDFNYWRERPLDIVDFTDSESEDEDYALRHALRRTGTNATRESILSEDEAADDMIASYMTDPRESLDESVAESAADEEELTSSMLDEDDEQYDDDDEEVDLDDERLDQEEVHGTGAPRTPEPEEGRPGSSNNLEKTPTQKRDGLSSRLKGLGLADESDSE